MDPGNSGAHGLFLVSHPQAFAHNVLIGISANARLIETYQLIRLVHEKRDHGPTGPTYQSQLLIKTRFIQTVTPQFAAQH